LTTIAPADNDTRLGSGSAGALAPPAATASTVGVAFSLFVATFVVGVGWLFATLPLARQAVKHNAARAVSKIILGIAVSFVLA
jgi:hypothetical protein